MRTLPATRQTLEQALANALVNVRRNALTLNEDPPTFGQPDLRYSRVKPGTWSWVAGFWSGSLWLAYAATNEQVFLEAARAQRPYFRSLLRQKASHNHDLGFLYTLSCVADARLTVDAEARDMALTAAASLASRYNPAGRFIRAWNPWPEHSNEGKIIIDCMENLPLLFWAAQETGEAHYYDVAVDHARISAAHLVRTDSSTYHTFDFDPKTGEPLEGSTHQGCADESCWSRGQGWGIHGFSLAYRATGLPEFLETARRLADYAIAQLPDDGVPYWDYRLPEDAPHYRDSSAAAITAAGLLLLAEEVTDPTAAEGYREVAAHILKNLHEHYSTRAYPQAEGLLLQGASHIPKGEADMMLTYGDYFYLEALLRAQGQRQFPW